MVIEQLSLRNSEQRGRQLPGPKRVVQWEGVPDGAASQTRLPDLHPQSCRPPHLRCSSRPPETRALPFHIR